MTDAKDIKLLILDVDGTLTDAGVYILEDGTQFKKFNARDGIGIRLAMKNGIDVGIISHSQVTTVVETRANMLGITNCYVGEESKLNVLHRWIKKMGLSGKQMAFIGDDINDLEIMGAVGLTGCPADASDKVKTEADILLSKKGGDGCVREFIDDYLLK